MSAISLGECTLNSMNHGVAAESKLCVVFTGHVLIKYALFIPVMYRAYTVSLVVINNRSIFLYGGYSDRFNVSDSMLEGVLFVDISVCT